MWLEKKIMTNSKPLSSPIIAYFGDVFTRHSASLIYLKYISRKLVYKVWLKLNILTHLPTLLIQIYHNSLDMKSRVQYFLNTLAYMNINLSNV